MIILPINNIINVQNEWPMLQNDFDSFLLDKYQTYEDLNAVHHYETVEVKNSKDVVVIPAGLKCESNYTTTYFDYNIQQQVDVLSSTCVTEVTNYQYEEKIEDAKRNIYILKDRYLGIIRDDMENSMQYKEGSTQYVNRTLKRAENIRLYS